ncbi:MAG: GAF domain-containing protein, partial [Anaerolineales bacterium]|nr:GAF domain-containing protein [Anaerolineales bacterium]
MDADLIRVLLIEDDPDDILLLKESLAEVSAVRIKLAHAGRLSEGLKRIAEQKFDVVLLDLNLPDSRGLDTLSSLLRQASTIPIVVLSGLADDLTTIEAVRQGAQDYLVKGEISGPMLGRVLRYAIERKRVGDTIRDSEEKFKTLFNSANDAIFTMNHTTFLDCNATTEKIFRCSRDQIVGHSPVDFSPEQQPDGSLSSKSAVEKIEAAFAGDPQFFEWLHTHLDGTPFDAEVSLNRVFIGGDFILQAIVRDITERVQAEETLRESESKYRIVADNTCDWEWWIDPEDQFIYNSPSCERITGHTVNEFMADTNLITWIIHPDDLPGYERHQREIKETPALGKLEFRVLHLDGTSRWIEHACQPVFDDKGVFLGTRGNNRDITERKQAEDALAASESELRALFTAMTDVVIVYDADGRYIKIAPTNPANLYRLADDMLGKTVHDILPKEQADYIVAKINEVLQTDQIVTGEYALQIGGKEIWFASSVSRLSENTVIWIAHDITKRKQVEEQIQRQVETLGALYDLSRTLAGMEDFNAILDVLTRRAVEATHVTFARVLLLENGDLVARSAYPVRVLDQDLQVGQREPLAAHPFCQRVLEGNDPRVLQLEEPEAGNCASFFLGIAQTLCVVPLRARERPLGLLMVGEARAAAREPFTEDKMRLAHNIGDQAASALQRALLHEETRRHLRELQILLEVSQAVTHVIELEPLLQNTLDAAVNALPAAEKGCILLADSAGSLQIRAMSGYRDRRILGSSFPPTSGYSARAFRERQPLIIAEARREDEIRYDGEIEEMTQIQSAIIAPLMVQDQPIGVIALDNATRANAFHTDDLRLLTTIAASVSAAIENARLFDETRQRVNELTAIHQIAQRLAKLSAPESLSLEIVKMLEETFGYDYAAVLLVDKQTGRLLPFAVSDQGHGEEFRQQDKAYVESLDIRLGQGVTGWVAQNGQSVLLDDVRRDARYIGAREGILSELCVPLLSGKQVIGVVNIETRTDAYEESDQRLLETVAAQMTVAIQNVNLLDETRQRLAELELLYQSGLALGQLLSPKEIGQKIIELLEQKMDWHHTTVRAYNPQDETLELLAFNQPGLKDEEERLAVEERFKTLISSQGLSGWAVLNSQIVRSGDVSHDPHYLETYPGLHSGLYVPIKSDERMLGVISIEN